ncbi:MAG: extracellular solute-binding protein [Clostridia bacterium]
MKKLLAILLAMVMVFSMVSFAAAEAQTTIRLWTFPVWGTDGTFEPEIIAAFEAANPGVKIELTTIDYQAGDDKLNAAIEAGTGPDVLLETPQRMNKYGLNGKMAPLDDMYTEEVLADFSAPDLMTIASLGNNGHYWTFPMSLTAHCMAINEKQWTDSGAMEFVNLEGDRCWKTEDFIKACEKLTEKGYMSSVVYCGGQGGDQGTRALVFNMYDAAFVNPEHTEWTIGSDAGKKALQQLKDMVDKGTISYDAGIVAGDELQLFANGTVATSLCWNALQPKNYGDKMDFKAIPLPFPSEDGVPVLEAGLYGFGVFDNGDAAKVEMAKKFVAFACRDAEWGVKAVQASKFFPVFKSLGDIYADSTDDQMPAYSSFIKYIGDLFNVMPSFVEQRPEWWGMLQYVFSGDKTVEQAVADYTTNCNKVQATYNK